MSSIVAAEDICIPILTGIIAVQLRAVVSLSIKLKLIRWAAEFAGERGYSYIPLQFVSDVLDGTAQRNMRKMKITIDRTTRKDTEHADAD